jgi:hypothetical protein
VLLALVCLLLLWYQHVALQSPHPLQLLGCQQQLLPVALELRLHQHQRQHNHLLLLLLLAQGWCQALAAAALSAAADLHP